MKLYRCISDEELIDILISGIVSPKPFNSNSDSTCPNGVYSFWFDCLVDLPLSAAIVIAEVENPKMYQMTWRSKAYSFDDTYEDFVCNEYVTSEHICINEILSHHEDIISLGNGKVTAIKLADLNSLISISKLKDFY